MANSKDGQDQKDKKKILSTEMTIYNMEALIFIIRSYD